jgi:PadR family transcriptional regulator, regulatory protein AphA
MARGNRTDFAVLGFLSRQAMTAYEIKTRLERGPTHNFWRESFGQLYPALKRMEDAGLVRGEDDPTEGGRRRRVYEITDAGMAAFVSWLGESPAPEPVRQELLLKLYFGETCGPAVCAELVRETQAESESLLESYEAIDEMLLTKYRDHVEMPYWRMTLRFGITRCGAMRDWCKETLAELDKLAKRPKARARSAKP